MLFSERQCGWSVLLPDGMLRVNCGNVRHPRLRQTLGDPRVEGPCLFDVVGVSLSFVEHCQYAVTKLKNCSFDIHILGTGTYLYVHLCMHCTVARDSQLMFKQITVFMA